MKFNFLQAEITTYFEHYYTDETVVLFKESHSKIYPLTSNYISMIGCSIKMWPLILTQQNQIENNVPCDLRTRLLRITSKMFSSRDTTLFTRLKNASKYYSANNASI